MIQKYLITHWSKNLLDSCQYFIDTFSYSIYSLMSLQLHCFKFGHLAGLSFDNSKYS